MNYSTQKIMHVACVHHMGKPIYLVLGYYASLVGQGFEVCIAVGPRSGLFVCEG